jgi:hypothetical protein
MKKIQLFILLFAAYNSFGQNSISATYGAEISTNLSTFSFNYSCDAGVLYLTLPAGKTYDVTSVGVTYKMTAANQGQQRDQFSAIKFLNTDTQEATEAQNTIATAGTFVYTRTINIANGNYNGGTVLIFTLSARRSWGPSFFNCSTDFNRVDASSWTITVNYSNEKNYAYVGIGTSTPSRGKLEVAGVAGSGNTSAVLGSDGAGISLQRNWPAIGFNQYRDNNFGFGKYIANGAASLFTLNPATGSIALDMYGIGLKNAQLPIGSRAISISRNYYVSASQIGFGGDADKYNLLTINKNTFNTNATAVFAGSEYSSFFCNGSNEDTYIRGGLNNSKVFVNDLSDIYGFSSKVKIIGKLAVGLGANQNPAVSTEIYGGLAFTKHPLVDATATRAIGTRNTSFIEVTTTLSNPTIELGGFEVKGTILIIKSVNKIKLLYQPTTYVQLEAGDTIMLIGDRYLEDFPGHPRSYWVILSISHNN